MSPPLQIKKLRHEEPPNGCHIDLQADSLWSLKSQGLSFLSEFLWPLLRPPHEKAAGSFFSPAGRCCAGKCLTTNFTVFVHSGDVNSLQQDLFQIHSLWSGRYTEPAYLTWASVSQFHQPWRLQKKKFTFPWENKSHQMRQMLGLSPQRVLLTVSRWFPSINCLTCHSAKFGFVLMYTVGTLNAECVLVSMSFT